VVRSIFFRRLIGLKNIGAKYLPSTGVTNLLRARGIILVLRLFYSKFLLIIIYNKVPIVNAGCMFCSMCIDKK